MMEIVFNDRAPHPNGHYSQAVVHGGILYMSMQLPIDPGAGSIPPALEDQATQLFKNCAAILSAAGSSFQDVLTATIYITEMADWPTMNRLFAEHVGNHRPARGMVNVKELHLGAKVALQLTAICRK